MTSPVVPSIEITSPSWTTMSPTRELACPAMSIASAPTTAGMPQPRATTAAWLTRPPRAVRMPCGHRHAVHVLGAGLGAHEDDLLAPVGGVGRVVGGEVDLAHRRAGRGGEALGEDLQRLAGELRVEHLVEVLGVDPLHRLGARRA